MAFDYSKLRGKIREIFKTQEAFASAIGVSRTTISAKLNSNVDFTQEEIAKSVEVLNLAHDEIPSYFFTPKV